jgi:hypothetical protein
MKQVAVMRIARPTDRLKDIVKMYAAGLDFDILAEFYDHDGFDGVVLGQEKVPYHLEFTTHRGHRVRSAPTQDNLIVFYIPDSAEWDRSCARMERVGFKAVTSYNPYWDARGKTFEDLDRYRVVLQNTEWSI